MKDYFGRKASSAASSTTLTESLDGKTRWPLEPSNGKNNKTPPEGKGLDAQTPYGPFQANGIASPKPPARKIHVPIRPAPITKTQPLQLPKPKEIDTARFDALIYSQSGASSPPPGIDLTPAHPPPPTKSTTNTATATETPSKNQQQPQDEPLYLAIDPRIHWPQAHSEAWHAAKRAEMRARGNRKANFGRAAQSLRKQQREAEKPFEETLPEKVADNPAWVRALRRLKGLPLVGAGAGAGSAGSVSGPEEDWATNGNGNGNGNGGDRRTRKHGGGSGSGSGGGVTGKRVGNSGLVVVTGLNGAQMGSMRRFDGSG
jgi:hypothetical protein